MNPRNLQTIKFRKLQWIFLNRQKISKSKHVAMNKIDIKVPLIQSFQEIIFINIF